ncbi:MAG: Gfo/Idh/MocA family oxidoreductase [Thermoguttaceae bacterium]|nr:Gfo/Idh/MocA family oxidoreductase [Thermoguttaceae bacterium]
MLKTNRRTFLKATAVAGASTLVVSDLLAQESPNEKVQFGCVGIGGKGASDSNDANRFGVVVAYTDTNRNQLKGGKRFKEAGDNAFEDYREMFDKMGDKIDAITVSTADHMHAIIAATGMKLGKHCFTQKPLTRTIFEARRLREIAAEKGLCTQMGNQGSAGDGLRESARMIRNGLLGEVKEVVVWSNRPIWPQGGERGEAQPVPDYLNWDCWLGVAPKRPYVSGAYDPFAWRGWWDFGSGALGDMACHTVNVAFAALDIKDPLWVQAITSGHNYDSLPKWSKISFEFPTNDLRPGFKFTWMDGGQRPDPALLEGKQPSGSGLLMIGEKGKFFSENDYGQDRDLLGTISKEEEEKYLAQAKEELKAADKYAGPYGGHFGEFVSAIKEGNPDRCWSNFPNYAGPLTETILLGNLAVWGASKPETIGPKIEWDAKNMKITNNPEDKARLEELVTPNYQNGYQRI